MIVIIVQGGVVQDVYSDDPREDVKVLDFDNGEPGVEIRQMERELVQVAKEMHQVL